MWGMMMIIKGCEFITRLSGVLVNMVDLSDIVANACSRKIRSFCFKRIVKRIFFKKNVHTIIPLSFPFSSCGQYQKWLYNPCPLAKAAIRGIYISIPTYLTS